MDVSPNSQNQMTGTLSSASPIAVSATASVDASPSAPRAMRFKAWLIAWLFLMVWSGIAFLALWNYLPAFYEWREPNYLNPMGNKPIVIRNDPMGEGHFGASRSNRRTHVGIDILAAMREAIVAPKSGRVTFAQAKGGYGNLIHIRHVDGRITRYGHLDSLTVSAGQWVDQGDVIGYVGKTGNADHRQILPHLHFEIRENDNPVDPMKFYASGEPVPAGAENTPLIKGDQNNDLS